MPMKGVDLILKRSNGQYLSAISLYTTLIINPKAPCSLPSQFVEVQSVLVAVRFFDLHLSVKMVSPADLSLFICKSFTWVSFSLA